MRCESCGAGLGPDAAWCGQCFAPVPTVAAPTPPRSAAAPFATAATGAATAAPVASAAAPFAAAAAPFAPAAAPTRGFAAAPPAPAAAVRRTRWAKTPTTFGPVGRLVATLLLLVPLAVMAVGGVADPFVWGGAGAYLAIVVPWGLKDIWKAGVVATR